MEPVPLSSTKSVPAASFSWLVSIPPFSVVRSVKSASSTLKILLILATSSSSFFCKSFTLVFFAESLSNSSCASARKTFACEGLISPSEPASWSLPSTELIAASNFSRLTLRVWLINPTRSVNREKFEAAISSVEGKLQDAGSLGEINPSQAKVFLAEAQEELDKLSAKNTKVKDLQKKLDELVAKINKIFKVELADFI